MKITKRQLRKIIRETSANKHLLSEQNWEEEAAKLDDEEQAGEIRTIGDLKKLIKQAQAKKRGEKAKENIKGALKDAVVDEILGKIPFAGTAKSLFDFVKSSYDLPDESRTGTALDHLDVDDDVAKIVDDPIENAFLAAFGEKLDGMDDTTDLETLNMTKNLSDYMKGKFNDRTVAGFAEGKLMRITKRQLRRIIREEKSRLVEDSIDSELDHLRKNIDDDKDHIDNLEKDIEDDREEMKRAHDDERKKNESHYRGMLKRQLRRIVRESCALSDASSEAALEVHVSPDVPSPEDYSAVRSFLVQNPDLVDLGLSLVMDATGASCERSTAQGVIDHLQDMLSVESYEEPVIIDSLIDTGYSPEDALNLSY